ncbi:hypothetical protein [Bdellovibrio sp. HCB209]|uniref:hypothetical protein n=1 Tax=Bdellovibrio sp. HCB209 TaxID=3394354 RepID=UPI0039B62059
MKKTMIALTLIVGTLLNIQAQAAMRPQVSCEMNWDISGKNDGSYIITGHGSSNPYIQSNSTAYVLADDGRGNPNWGQVSVEDNGGENVKVKFEVIMFGQEVNIDHEQDIVLQDPAGTIKCHVYRIKDLRNAYDNLSKVSEPEPYKLQKSSKNLNHWMFGSSTFPYANVITETKEIRADSGFGVTEQDAILNTNFATFVGYEVISNWHDGSNGNWSTDEKCMGNTRCIIELRSKQFRGMNFTVKMYWIPNWDFAQDWHFNTISYP